MNNNMHFYGNIGRWFEATVHIFFTGCHSISCTPTSYSHESNGRKRKIRKSTKVVPSNLGRKRKLPTRRLIAYLALSGGKRGQSVGGGSGSWGLCHLFPTCLYLRDGVCLGATSPAGAAVSSPPLREFYEQYGQRQARPEIFLRSITIHVIARSTLGSAYAPRRLSYVATHPLCQHYGHRHRTIWCFYYFCWCRRPWVKGAMIL